MVILFALGVPIAYTLGMTGLVAILTVGTIKLEIVPLMVFNGATTYTLVAIPLFILMGQIMNHSSLAVRLIDFASAIVGFIRGGLAMTTVMAGMMMAAISGSSVADAAALGSVLIPQMEKRGYGKSLAVSSVSAAATLAAIIPPSTNLIMYAVIAGVSVTDVFIAGVIPGVCIGLGLMVVIYIFALKMNLPVEQAFAIPNIVKQFKRAGLCLLLPLLVIGGIIFGFFTPTEAGAFGVVYALSLGVVVYRELSFKQLINALKAASRQTSVVLIMVSTSALLGWYVTQQQIPQQLAEFMLGISTNKYIILLMVNILILIAGMFLQAAPLIIMLVPMVAPLVAGVGVNLVQFGVIMGVALCIGQITPPVASVLMTTCGIGEISMEKTLNTLLPMIGVLILVLIIASVLPSFSLWLPTLFAS
ncbi:MAG: TRAP transporter large permease [Peptococcaceae bacterium]|nr:TRAP transporter large permease [Peptococcaceae bacterium]